MPLFSRRVRPPEKMARNRDLTAARRQEENMMISEFTKVLPLHKEQLKKADRTTLIRLALHFIKMKELLGSAIPSEAALRWIFHFLLLLELCAHVVSDSWCREVRVIHSTCSHPVWLTKPPMATTPLAHTGTF